MNIKKLPTAETMKAELDTLTAEKHTLYTDNKAAPQEAKEYSTIKQNVDILLSVPKEHEKEKSAER